MLTDIKAAIIALTLAVSLTVPWLAFRDFATRGEPREALVAQSMLVDHSLTLGHGYSGVIPSKPPLLHWLMVASSSVLGELDEFAARFPSAISSAIFLAFFTFTVSRFTSPPIALLAALLTLTSFEWLRASTNARVDMLLAVSQVGSLLAFLCWFSRPSLTPWIISIAALTAAILAKGPVGAVLNAIVITLFLYLRGCAPRGALFRAAAFVLPALILASLWYWAAAIRGGAPFLERFIYENFERFTGTMHDDPHHHSVLYLYGTLFLGLLPWSLLLIKPAALRVKAISLSYAGRISLKQVRAKLSGISPLILLCYIAILTQVLFFSVPASKRSVYLLPIYPWIALLMAPYFAIHWKLVSRFVTICSAIILGALGSIILTPNLTQLLPPLMAHPLELARNELYYTQIAFLLVAFAVSLVGVLANLRDKTTKATKISTSSFSFLIVLVIIQAIAIPAFMNPQSEKRMLSGIEEFLPKNTSLYSFGNEFYGMSFYLGREITRLELTPAAMGAAIISYDSRNQELKNALAIGQHVEELGCSSLGVKRVGRKLCVYQVTAKENFTPLSHPAHQSP